MLRSRICVLCIHRLRLCDGLVSLKHVNVTGRLNFLAVTGSSCHEQRQSSSITTVNSFDVKGQKVEQRKKDPGNLNISNEQLVKVALFKGQPGQPALEKPPEANGPQVASESSPANLEGASTKVEGFPPWVHSDLDRSIYLASDVEELMRLTESVDFGIFQATRMLSILNSWRQEKNITYDTLNSDPRFRNVKALFESGAAGSGAYYLLLSYQHFLFLGTSLDEYVMQCIENSMLWKVSKANCGELIHLVTYFHDHQNTADQKKLLEVSTSMLQNRFIEIKDPTEIMMILGNERVFGSEFVKKVETKALAEVGNMTIESLIGILCTLARSGRRPTPLLRSIAFHLTKEDKPLPIKFIADVLFALNSVNFPDKVVLQKLCRDAVDVISTVTGSSVLGSILTSLGQLKYRHQGTLEVFSQWCLDNLSVCRNQDLVALIMTLGAVNFVPEGIPNLIQSVAKSVRRAELPDHIWLDYVYSLAILGHASADDLSSVLSQSFCQNVLDSRRSNYNILQTKLVNLDNVARLECKDYKGNQLSKDFSKDLVVPHSKDNETTVKSILEAISNFVPAPKYLNKNVTLPFGVYVDAECLLDSNGNPLQLSDFGSSRDPSKSNTKKLSKGSIRVAIIYQDFRSLCLGTDIPIGSRALAIRLLEQNNYQPVLIHHADYNVKDSLVSRVKRLEKQIRATIQSEPIEKLK